MIIEEDGQVYLFIVVVDDGEDEDEEEEDGEDEDKDDRRPDAHSQQLTQHDVFFHVHF